MARKRKVWYSTSVIDDEWFDEDSDYIFEDVYDIEIQFREALVKQLEYIKELINNTYELCPKIIL